MRVAGEIELYSRTVVDPPTVWPGPPGPQSCARADSVARALERPASGFSHLSVSRVLCLYLPVVDGCGGGLLPPGGFSLQIYGITDLRIDPPPSPSRGPAVVRRRSTNQVGAGRRGGHGLVQKRKEDSISEDPRGRDGR